MLSTNPESLMLDFPNNVSLSVSVYYMAKAVDERNVDLDGLAAIASCYESALDIEKRIIKESKKHGIIDVVKCAKFYFDDLKKSILYLAGPILDISGNAKAVDHLLKSLDISGGC
jgi:hypothetical protein